MAFSLLDFCASEDNLKDVKQRPPAKYSVRTSKLILFLGLFAASVSCGLMADPVPAKMAHEASVGNGIALFVPDGYNSALTPSLAVETTPEETGPVSQGWNLTPRFFTDNGHACASLAVPAGSSLYGSGEVTGPLLRNGMSIELWNTDNFNYKKNGGKRLYQSHPWVLGVRPDGTAFGILFNTSWKAQLETKSDLITLRTEGSPFQVFVIDRNSPLAVVEGLSELTGTMPLPPEWALGFHQCRYSYFPDAKVREIADGFRSRQLPCDVIWMDIDYMNGFRVFTFDPSRFPDPKATNDYLHKNGFHSVWMIDPGVKVDPGYSVYASGSQQGVWVRAKDGSDFHGEVWAGTSVFPDFTMPSTREWWANLYQSFIAQGIDGVWNDMNEPSVFHTPDGTMPEENVHRGGGDLPPGPHRLYHNVYGMLMTMASRNGIQRAQPDKRPFVLTRSNFLGGQRYAATWTGDNDSAMSYLQTSIPMCLNLGLSGQPLCGPDIGGYTGKVTPDLYGKWIAMGPFFPFFRAHTDKSNPPREPWVFGPKIENVARTALDRRYRMLPYLYTLAYEASLTGDPIIEPAFFADPTDPALRSEQQAFLLGANLLIVPRWADDPHLPQGIWRDVSLLDGKQEQDGFQPTLKIRGGAIIPLGRVIQNTGEPSLDPLTLDVCLDKNGRAEGSLYEDSGNGFGYKNGNYALSHYEATTDGGSVTVRMQDRSGEMKIPDRNIVVRLISDKGVIEGQGEESESIVISKA